MAQVSGSSVVEGVLIDWVVHRPVEPSRLPPEWLSDEQLAAELQRVQRRRAQDAAHEAELVLALAGQRHRRRTRRRSIRVRGGRGGPRSRVTVR
ncbi:hypothetical protein [Modestobacter roseus]|uniref:hypothetical protein n=1 Tax=Modestobacter roseus TaxID=1181884 RepID=UPI001E2DE419|nr:hypothetical protein [Modestobacter roseus]